jgi:hypothetical protein
MELGRFMAFEVFETKEASKQFRTIEGVYCWA